MILANAFLPWVIPFPKIDKSFSNKKISALPFIISTAKSTEIEISYSFMAGLSLIQLPIKPTTWLLFFSF